jgi:hypothetical protein
VRADIDIEVPSCRRAAHHRDRRQHEISIALAASECPTSRDCVPWRFLDAGQLSLPSVSSLPASKNLHNIGLMHRSNRQNYSITSPARLAIKSLHITIVTQRFISEHELVA